MARYIGPKTKIARKFGEPIYGPDKVLAKKNYPPGQHGLNRRKKMSEYAVQLREKQKAKYTYGVLERKSLEVIAASLNGYNHSKFPWIEWNESSLSGKFLHLPEREDIPENIKEQLIVELYSK